MFPNRCFVTDVLGGKQNCLSNLKFGTQTNSNMQSSIVMFTFFCFRLEIHFLGKFGPKKLNWISKLKYGTLANSNVLNSMSMLNFFCFFLARNTTLSPKTFNYLFKLKCGTKTSLLLLFQSRIILFGQIQCGNSKGIVKDEFCCHD